MTESQLITRKGVELHCVFDQTRPGGEARPGQSFQPRIIVLNRPENAVIIGAGRLCDQVEFIGRGKLDVSISIAKQLGELGLYRGDDDDFRNDKLE